MNLTNFVSRIAQEESLFTTLPMLSRNPIVQRVPAAMRNQSQGTRPCRGGYVWAG